MARPKAKLTKYKKCKICKHYKLLKYFYTDKLGKHSKAVHCKSCYKNFVYPKNKRLMIDYNKKFKAELKLKSVQYKGGKCTDCGGVFPPCAFDFHHIHGPKRIMSAITKWDEVRKELDKCVLLCANCHRIRHNDINQITVPQ